MAKTEDETDVKATSKALAEQDADLAEFDETIPYEGEEGTKSKDDVSKVEIELAQLDNQVINQSWFFCCRLYFSSIHFPPTGIPFVYGFFLKIKFIKKIQMKP